MTARWQLQLSGVGAVKASAATMSTRSPHLGGNEQLAASAGVSAEGKSLTEIAAAKFARDTDPNH